MGKDGEGRRKGDKGVSKGVRTGIIPQRKLKLSDHIKTHSHTYSLWP